MLYININNLIYSVMYLLDEIILFFENNSKFFFLDRIEEKTSKVEKKMKWAFRKQFSGRFEEYKDNLFFFPEINSFFKLMFWDNTLSIMPLKKIVNISKEGFVFAIFFNNWDYDLRIANLPLLKKASNINYDSEHITWSVKWDDIDLFYVNRDNQEMYANNSSSVYNIINALENNNIDFNEELSRVYNYRADTETIWQEKIHNELYILESESIKEFVSYIYHLIKGIQSGLSNILKTCSPSMQEEVIEYVITLISNDEEVKRHLDLFKLTNSLPAFEYKNKMNTRRDDWNTDFHFLINWQWDYSEFLSESKSSDKLVYILNIDFSSSSHIKMYVEWFYSKRIREFIFD